MGGEITVTNSEQKHPADELGKALSRANGILTLLAGCFEKPSNSFETGNAFVFESITAVEAMLNTATLALERLYQTCDLSVIRQPQMESLAEPETPIIMQAPPTAFQPVVIQPVTIQPEAPMQLQAPNYQQTQHNYGSSYLGFFGPAEPATDLSDKIDSILVNMPARPRAKHAEIFEKPAENYDELLQKLTALADVAAYQAHQSNQDGGLGSALEELRADLIKLRSVA
jgi:hypothetical protein